MLALFFSGSTDWDDIWLLRWVLSFPDPLARIEAVKKAIVYRRDNEKLLANALAGGSAPNSQEMQRFNINGFHGTSKLGEPVCLLESRD